MQETVSPVRLKRHPPIRHRILVHSGGEKPGIYPTNEPAAGKQQHSMIQTSKPLTKVGKFGSGSYIPELDCIRAIGISLVLLIHLWPHALFPAIFRVTQMGWMAMDAFFVLSGFLITGILVDTRSRADYFRNYYARRALRIFPLYYCTLLAAIAVLQFSHGPDYSSFTRHWGSPAWFVFYIGNFKIAYLGRYPPARTLSGLWSLQIEEQFYLLLPWAVRFLQREQLSRMLWSFVFLSPLLRLVVFWWNPANRVAQFVLLPCHMEGLALGALIAIRFRSGPWKISKARLTILVIGLISIICLSPLVEPSLTDNYSPFNRLVGYSLSSWACACIVMWLIAFRGSRYTRLLRSAPVRYLATTSYGIYLLHPLVLHFVSESGRFGLHLPYGSLSTCLATIGLSTIGASVSWYTLERPIARLKEWLFPSRLAARAEIVAPAASEGLVSSPNGAVAPEAVR